MLSWHEDMEASNKNATAAIRRVQIHALRDNVLPIDACLVCKYAVTQLQRSSLPFCCLSNVCAAEKVLNVAAAVAGADAGVAHVHGLGELLRAQNQASRTKWMRTLRYTSSKQAAERRCKPWQSGKQHPVDPLRTGRSSRLVSSDRADPGIAPDRAELGSAASGGGNVAAEPPPELGPAGPPAPTTSSSMLLLTENSAS